jgi:hypothetical protein
MAQAAVRTELYIKTGLVDALSGDPVRADPAGRRYGIVQAGARRHRRLVLHLLDREEVPGRRRVRGGASVRRVHLQRLRRDRHGRRDQGRGQEDQLTASIVIVTAIPMLILQPLVAKWLGMSDLVSGAWLGGTLDTSGSVVAAGALISEAAMKTGVIVKMSQNVLIGVAAFVLSIVWTMRAVKATGVRQSTSALEIWERFPKFVLGFVAASVVFSFLLAPETVAATKGALGGLRTWWFALAFTCIGLETKFGDIAKMEGGRPAFAFLIGQGFNIVWTLVLAWLLFGGVLFAAPIIK